MTTPADEGLSSLRNIVNAWRAYDTISSLNTLSYEVGSSRNSSHSDVATVVHSPTGRVTNQQTFTLASLWVVSHMVSSGMNPKLSRDLVSAHVNGFSNIVKVCKNVGLVPTLVRDYMYAAFTHYHSTVGRHNWSRLTSNIYYRQPTPHHGNIDFSGFGDFERRISEDLVQDIIESSPAEGGVWDEAMKVVNTWGGDEDS